MKLKVESDHEREVLEKVRKIVKKTFIKNQHLRLQNKQPLQVIKSQRIKSINFKIFS